MPSIYLKSTRFSMTVSILLDSVNVHFMVLVHLTGRE
ncbi:hypothetical protein KSF78_0003245 [Schistosoma japonicum]|nr:hypothetical protein KSF78_0003245 [Schistosoma japonicum]